jgi:hypothetical protein
MSDKWTLRVLFARIRTVVGQCLGPISRRLRGLLDTPDNSKQMRFNLAHGVLSELRSLGK